MSIYNINTASIDNLLASGSLVGTASCATTASYAMNVSVLVSGSVYEITSSWAISSSYSPLAQSSISASWASSSISASYVPNLYPQVYQANTDSASFASSSLSASYAPVDPDYSSSIASTKQDTLINSLYVLTASLSISASYYPPFPNVIEIASQSLFASQSIYANSASWVSASVKITTADTASYVVAANIDGIVNAATNAIFASQSIYSTSASWVSASVKITTADTASYVAAANIDGVVNAATNAVFASQSLYATNSIYAISASWVSASVKITTADTTSYVSAVNVDGMVYTATSSIYATQSIYANSASWVSASVKITTADTASYVSASNIYGIVNSASYAISASYAPMPVISVSSSWASSSISSSNADTASYVKASNIDGIVASASIAKNALTSSTADSFLVRNNLTVDGILYASQLSSSKIYITSSELTVTSNILTLNAMTPYMRYAGIEMYDSGSTDQLASFLWDGENNYFFLSSSDGGYSRKIITGPELEGNLTPGYVPIAIDQNGIVDSIISQSGTLITINGTLSASSITSAGELNGNLIGTSSWANNSVSSSYVATASYYPVITNVLSSSWASSSISASYSLSSSYAPSSISSTSSSYSSTASYLNPGANIYLSQSYLSSVTSSAAPAFQPATLFWDDNAKTYAIYSDHSGVSLQIGQEQWIRVYAGEYIPNGSPVYVSSSLSNLPIVKLALSDGLVNTYKNNVVGLSTENISSGSIGVITSQGQVHDVDTSLYNAGQLLYLSNTNSGSLMGTPPLTPYEEVVIGYVLDVDNTNGIIQVNIINTGLREFTNVGMTSVPTIVGTGAGSFNVGTANVNLCTTTDGIGPVFNYQIPSSSFTITSSFIDVQYLITSYNSGSPVYSVVTDLSNIDDIQSTPVATFTIGTSGNLSYIDWDTSGILLSNKLNKKIIDLYGAQQASGLMLAYSASHITLTAGTGYIGVKKLTFTTASTVNTNQFVLLSHSASVWSGSVINGWINTHYDNGTNLTPIDNNKYVVNYVYRGIGSLNRSQVILSNQYNQYADAVASTVATPPAELKDIAILTGRIITQQGNATPLLVESAFTTILSVAGVTNHNDLLGLQGGTTNQYYHLTAAEYTDGSGSSGPFVRQTGSFLFGTASYSNNALSASYVISASYAPSTIPTSVASASWASSSISASYAPGGLSLSGTDNYIPKWSSNSLTPSSSIYDITVISSSISSSLSGSQSPYGTVWTSLTTSTAITDNRWRSVAYGNNTYVAVGGSNSTAINAVMTSPDTINWTARTSSVNTSTNGWRKILYASGTFITVGAGTFQTGSIMTSPDGIIWTNRTSSLAGTNYLYDITYGSGTFVAVNNSDNQYNSVITSPDGINWTTRTSSVANITNYWNGITYAMTGSTSASGIFVAVGGQTHYTASIMTSPDAINWTSRTSSIPNANQYLLKVTYGNGLFVAVNYLGTSTSSIITSPDGITWTSRTSSILNIANWFDVTYASGTFIAINVGNGSKTGSIMTSPDGINWSLQTSSINTSNTLIGVSFANNNVFVSNNLGTSTSSLMISTASNYENVNTTLYYSSSKVGILTTSPTSSLHVFGDITATTITASFLTGTASYALSASYAPSTTPTSVASASWASSSISSSYALTSSNLLGFVFNNTQSIISSINTQTVITQITTGSYIAAFFDYAAVSASNIRAGIVFGSWVNGNVNYTEVSNVDIGDTSPVTMSMGLNGAIVQLSASANTNLWTIKAMSRYL